LDLHAAAWTADTTCEIRPGARRFESWEANYADRLGLGAAVDYALELSIEATSDRLCELAADLRDSLTALDGVSVHDKGATRGGIVTFTVDGVDSVDVQAQLLSQRINTAVAPAGHARLDLPHRGLPSLVRASLHYYNTVEETTRFVDAVHRLRRRLAAVRRSRSQRPRH